MVLQILSTCQKVVSQSKDVQIISSNIPKLALKVFNYTCYIYHINILSIIEGSAGITEQY